MLWSWKTRQNVWLNWIKNGKSKRSEPGGAGMNCRRRTMLVYESHFLIVSEAVSFYDNDN
jgi:hypothetical protein